MDKNSRLRDKDKETTDQKRSHELTHLLHKITTLKDELDSKISLNSTIFIDEGLMKLSTELDTLIFQYLQTSENKDKI